MISVRISFGCRAISRAFRLAGATKNFATSTSRLPVGRHQLHLGAKRHQRRSQARCADETRRSAAEDRVILVLAASTSDLPSFMPSRP